MVEQTLSNIKYFTKYLSARFRPVGPAEWDDPVFQAEIVAATGVDLNPGKNQRKGKKKEKYPGLTNLNQKKDRARSRLEKRVLNP